MVVLVPIAYTLTISLFLSEGIYVLFTVVTLIFFICLHTSHAEPGLCFIVPPGEGGRGTRLVVSYY